MERASYGGWAMTGFVVASFLLAAGLLVDRDPGAERRAVSSPRVVLVGIPGLSWPAVAGSMQEGRLPVLSRLTQGESAKGDLITTGHGSDAESLASLVTGRLAFKHGIHHADQLALFETHPNPMRRTVWEWIGANGGRVSAIGFPIGSMAESPERVVDKAVRILRTDPDRHLFIYLDGFDRQERRHGYEAIDGILGRLVAAGGEQTTWMLVSERGNAAGVNGFFMAWGHGVKRSVRQHTVAPVDLATTLTYLSDSPIPIDMDGVVLFELLDDGYFFRQRLAFQRQRPRAGS